MCMHWWHVLSCEPATSRFLLLFGLFSLFLYGQCMSIAIIEEESQMSADRWINCFKPKLIIAGRAVNSQIFWSRLVSLCGKLTVYICQLGRFSHVSKYYTYCILYCTSNIMFLTFNSCHCRSKVWLDGLINIHVKFITVWCNDIILRQ